MNTWSIVKFFLPERSFFLDNHLQLDKLKTNISFFVTVVAPPFQQSHDSQNGWRQTHHIGWGIDETDPQYPSLFERGIAEILLSDLELKTKTFVGIDESLADHLTFNEATNVECLKETLLAANVTQLLLNFGLKKLEIIAFDGAEFPEKRDQEREREKREDENTLEHQIDELLDNALLLFVTSYGKAIPAFLNGFVAGPVVEKLNTLILKFTKRNEGNGDGEECQKDNDNGTDPNWQLNKAGAILSFLFALAAWIFMCVCIYIAVRNKKKRGLYNNELLMNQMREASLIMTPHLPLYVRFGVPLFLLCNIALFISSNTSVGASVYLIVNFGGHELQSESLFNFTLMSSIREMWEAGVISLALLIAIFSGAWPYIKLFTMFLCWTLPPILLSVKGREKVLMFLDAMGKWSLIDAFILVFMMVVFSFNVTIPPASSLLGFPPIENPIFTNITTIRTYVVPQMGFHSFVLATIASLIITHILLVFHRRVSTKELEVIIEQEDETYRRDDTMEKLLSEINVEDISSKSEYLPLLNENEMDRLVIVDLENDRRPLSSHSFHILGKEKIEVRFTLGGTILVVCSILLSLGFLLAGGMIDSFSFEFSGAAATLLTYMGQGNHKPFSLISLAMALPESSISPNSFSIRWIQISFMLFAFIIPLLYIAILLFLWIIPLRSKEQKVVFIIAEIIRAWSSMEVFVLALATALIALQQFTKFIIGNRCNLIDVLLKRFLPWIFAGGVETCFDIKTTLLRGCWLMFIAVAIYIVVGQIVMSLCHKVIQERDHLYQLHHNSNISASDSSDYSDNVDGDIGDSGVSGVSGVRSNNSKECKGCGCFSKYMRVFKDYLVYYCVKCRILEKLPKII